MRHPPPTTSGCWSASAEQPDSAKERHALVTPLPLIGGEGAIKPVSRFIAKLVGCCQVAVRLLSGDR